MNARKQFAKHLATLSPDSLFERYQRTRFEYLEAQKRGDCSLEAVLYFDLQQITAEINKLQTRARLKTSAVLRAQDMAEGRERETTSTVGQVIPLGL